MNPTEARTRGCKIAEGMGWFLGQAEDRSPQLYRPGHPPKTFPTWLSALTWLMGQRELLPRGELRQPVPVAQHAPPVASAPPMAKICDRHGRILPGQ